MEQENQPYRLGRIKYDKIPEELRNASRLLTSLLRADKPVPDEVRTKHNLYKRWLKCGGRDPETVEPKTKPIKHAYIPADLRNASTECSRLKRKGKPVPQDIADKATEYRRWLRHGGEPPDRKEYKRRGSGTNYEAYLEWSKLRRQGVAPGDMPKKIIEGRANHLGIATKKYTKCAPSAKSGGRGCRGRHGHGWSRMRYNPGVAMCMICGVAYSDVPEDVTGCGCCGQMLRKNARF